jgi:hypothetical protein
MPALLRSWAALATLAAVLLALRGAWLAAVALFVLSPAPAWLASRASFNGRLSITWLGAVVGAFAVVIGLVLLVTYLGGIPQVHEWRAALRSS